MRAVVSIGDGRVDLNFMWLPTAFGMNSLLKQEIEKTLASKIQGLSLDDKGLDQAHDIVVKFLVEKFPEIQGLDRLLDSLKYVEIRL